MISAAPSRRDPRAPAPTLTPGVEPAHRITFPDGLPGYEACRAFVLLDNPAHAPLRMLRAEEAHGPCFLAVEPSLVMPGYRCALATTDRLRLGAAKTEPLVWLALVTVEDGGVIAVNLRAPIAINPRRMTARQVMSNDERHHLRHVIGAGA